MTKIPGHSAWGLTLAGFLVLLAGIGVAYGVREWGSIFNQQERIRLILLYTSVASGIFFIAATARWWMRH